MYCTGFNTKNERAMLKDSPLENLQADYFFSQTFMVDRLEHFQIRVSSNEFQIYCTSFDTKKQFFLWETTANPAAIVFIAI